VWCDAVYFGTTAQTLQRIVEQPPYATSKNGKKMVLTMVVWLWYERRWFHCVTLLSVTLIRPTNDGYALVRLVAKPELQKKKRNPSARPTPRHISFLFLFPAFSEWMLFGSKRFIRTGKHTAWETVYYMWCRLSAMRMQRQTDLYELRQSCDVLRVASFRVQFHANVTKRQLAWQGLLNRRMRTLPTCRTVALHSVA